MTEVPSRRFPGTPCWASLLAHRADLAQSFYGALFGWEFVPGPQQLGPYRLAVLDGRRIAGIGEGTAEPGRPGSWTTVFATDDADQAAELVRECGGTVGIGPLNADDEGRLAIAVDPSGAVFGIWQGKRVPGTDLSGVAGSVAWSELLTPEAAIVAKFYQAVFGFETVPTAPAAPNGVPAPPDGGGDDRVVLRAGGRAMADVHGMGAALPRDRGAHWITYFEVTDTTETARRAAGLGGRVLGAPHDSAHGRVARIADPEGAVFAVVASGGRG
jgi:predicted enzyme related to lactoylglutathione lyase